MCRGARPITPDQRKRIESIINFYFPKGWDRDTFPGESQMAIWFGASSPTLDQKAKQLFLKDYENLRSGEYSGWICDRDGRLATVLLLDQYSRMMFRGTAKAFEADLNAQNLSMKTLDDKELWNQYKVYERYFLLLPLMHAEDPKITRR